MLGAAQSGTRSQRPAAVLLRDEDLIAAARDEATALRRRPTRGLADHPLLPQQVAALAADERAECLEKA